MCSEEARPSQPGGVKGISAAGEGHHARLASPHLPALHPCVIISPFSLHVSRVLCLSSHLWLPKARQRAKTEAAGLGSVLSVPVARAAVGALGLLRVFLSLLRVFLSLLRYFWPSAPGQLCPKCLLCPQLSHGSVSSTADLG